MQLKLCIAWFVSTQISLDDMILFENGEMKIAQMTRWAVTQHPDQKVLIQQWARMYFIHYPKYHFSGRGAFCRINGSEEYRTL
jgi:hypothetical protein